MSLPVDRIVAGDTIVVVIEGKSYDLRYIGMDSAEVGDAFGTEATAANDSDALLHLHMHAHHLEKVIAEARKSGVNLSATRTLGSASSAQALLIAGKM